MAAVSEQCLAVVPQPVPPVSLMDDEVTTSDSEASSNEMVILESSPKGLAGKHIRLPAQTSLPLELAAKLERQDSDDSVVSSTEEEGIQADSAPEVCDVTETRVGEGLEPRSERSSSVVSDGSEEGGRDSGIEAEREPDMVVPDEEQMARIVAQVEFYFSDANVAKDKFLLKHIRRNKEGYVSLKLVSSFKKVKQLTKDWRVVSFSLNKKSSKIQINDLGTKIRRVDPLPDLEEVPVTCAVLALALPLAKPSIQSVSELFSSCGDIAFIRVVRAGTAIPQDLKGLSVKHPALSDTNCAWIEFETPEAAKAATEMSTEDGLKVVPILPEAQKKPEKAPQQKGSQPNSRKNSVTSNSSYGSPIKGPPSRKNSVGTKSRKDSGLGSDVEIPMPQPRYPRRKCLSLPQTQSPNLKELSAVVEARKNRPKSKSCTEFQLGSPPPTSWVQRNLLAAAAASAASAASPVVGSRPPLTRPNRVSHGSLPVPEGVLRFPKGPDGSKGFSPIHRRRTVSAQETVPRPGSPSSRGSDTGSSPATSSDKPSATTPAPATNTVTTPDITTITNTSKSNDSGNSSSGSSSSDSSSSASSSSSSSSITANSSGNSENSSSNTDGS